MSSRGAPGCWPPGGGHGELVHSDLANAYESTGARIQGIENMTLEEIFVAKVEQSRGEATYER